MQSEDEAKANAPLFKAAQSMLRDWEAGNEEVVALWEKMNAWVYAGFDVTYANLGVNFDSYYYESDTYLLGKTLVEEGLEKEVLYRKDDGSVWIDLTDEGLDEKLLLRADGTAVYMTQDLGTALQRFRDNPSMSGMVYTLGTSRIITLRSSFNLKEIGLQLGRFALPFELWDGRFTHGKMKSRKVL